MSIKPKTVVCVALRKNCNMEINDTFSYLGSCELKLPSESSSEPFIRVVHKLRNNSTQAMHFFDAPAFSKHFRFASKEKPTNKCVSIW